MPQLKIAIIALLLFATSANAATSADLNLAQAAANSAISEGKTIINVALNPNVLSVSDVSIIMRKALKLDGERSTTIESTSYRTSFGIMRNGSPKWYYMVFQGRGH